MSFESLLRTKKFLLTSEVHPPRSASLDGLKKDIRRMRVDAINVVDMSGAYQMMSPLPAAIAVKQAGKEPIMQVACRDRNVLALQGDLLGAAAFGIKNILAITGDSPNIGDAKEAKGVFHLNSLSLLELISALNSGKTFNGHRLFSEPPGFFPGAGINMNSPQPEFEAKKTKQKLERGAKFFQTQVVFNPENIGRFFETYERLHKEDIRKKVLVGVVLLHAGWLIDLLKGLPGVIIPPEDERRIKEAKEPIAESVSIALETIDKIKPFGVGGLHVIPAENIDALELFCKKYGKC